MKLFLVEPDPNLRRSLGRLLARVDDTIVEAVEKPAPNLHDLFSAMPDCVVLDVGQLWVADTIRRCVGDTVPILLTYGTFAGDEEMAFAMAGADPAMEAISKPFVPNELTEKIRRLVQRGA